MRFPTHLPAALGLALFGWSAPACAQHPPLLQLPERSPGARTGTQLTVALNGLGVPQRETLLWHELASGNVPEFLRELVPVTTTATIQGRVRTATFWCTPDYVGLGEDGDWFRMPMSPELAQQLCDRLDCALPTRRMVDAIWAAAPLKLAPAPISPSSFNIQSLAVFRQHHQQIEAQRQNHPLGQQPGLLIAGIKKDVVASSLIASWPGRVCIYGWHYPSGTAIQPLSKVHTSSYMDYSHGVRLVARRVEVDGIPMTLDAVLADPLLHPLLSDEGRFGSWRYPSAGRESFPVIDRFPAAGPECRGWRAKFTNPVAVPTNPAPPSGDPTALRIMDPVGGTDSLRFEPGQVRDVVFQADLLCGYRPGLSADGFERIGIFVRDRAAGAFDGTLSQQGACYALTWDSHDGRLRCLRAAGGNLVDLLPTPRFVTGTAWRRFRIMAEGTALRFHLDGELLLATEDTTHPDGAFGIGYHEYFASNANMRGTRVDGCHGDVPGALRMALVPGLSRGTVEVQRRRGVPGDRYFTVFTLAPRSFPNGWLFGLDPTPGEVTLQLGSGLPVFLGTLDATGTADVTVPALPLGLPLYGVTATLDPSSRLQRATQPVTLVVR